MKGKRLLAWLLMLCMIWTLQSGVVAAVDSPEDASSYEIILFSLYNGTYEIVLDSKEHYTVDSTGDVIIEAKAGTLVTVKPSPDLGFRVGEITVLNEEEQSIKVSGPDSAGRYTFIMPEGSVQVIVQFARIKMVLNQTALHLIKDGPTDAQTSVLQVVSIQPENLGYQLVWSSNNEKVAKVNQDGVVTAVGPGETTIVAALLNDQNHRVATVSCKVTVTQLWLDPSTLTLTTGDTAHVTASALLETVDETIIWSTSDAEVAAVENGIVTAGNAGTAVITAATGDGRRSASCAVTVKDKAICHTLAVSSEGHGSATVSLSTCVAGETVTIETHPESGYTLEKLTALDADNHVLTISKEKDGVYTLVMPDADVRITASFVETSPPPNVPDDTLSPEPDSPSAGELPFTDLQPSAWYYESVQYVYDHHIATGISATEYGPALTTNRAMFVTFLYRLAQEETPVGNVFADVSQTAYYADAVSWAVKNKIVLGDGAGHFLPERPITREEMATMFYRFAVKDAGYAGSTDLNTFSDADAVSDWATEALRWSAAEGLIVGYEDWSLRPAGATTRAEMAAVLMRFCKAAES